MPNTSVEYIFFILLALAVGILIGLGLGSDMLVSSIRRKGWAHGFNGIRIVGHIEKKTAVYVKE